MTYLSALWVTCQFTSRWETTTVTTSTPRFIIEDFTQLLIYRRAQDAPHSLDGALANQFSWSALVLYFSSRKSNNILYRNYDHVASLWQLEQWLPGSAVSQARSHYAAYSVQRTDGLRIISLNTDLCKRHRVSGVELS